MPATQLTKHLAAALKEPSPNLKTALRLCDAWTSYSYDTMKAIIDECVVDDYVWNALPESIILPGWNQMKKSEFIEAFGTAWWPAMKGMQMIVLNMVENENNVILYTKLGPSAVSAEGNPIATSYVHRFRSNASGKVVEQRDFLDTKFIHDFWWSEPQRSIVAGGSPIAAGGNR
ncbi:uncharacterized protein EI90DRAFT_3014723 [Cantharellus anzutake]|uniref:uncharacterized protein n=1 Tax=Cantharellus anzutake TaxID=1750568 RepID=UPI0019061AAF|nr:uncharacterized protein EI90DRAFT_3014723 [Cantharellus anzutake]KAF8334862.1 hypothetical protein EI90DRAFT_3014723 [Cantharellus anzutake]